jgi:hypothetical protein
MEKLAASVAEAPPGCRTVDAKAWGWELGRWTARSSMVIVVSLISASGAAKAWPMKNARQTLSLTCTQADDIRGSGPRGMTYGRI